MGAEVGMERWGTWEELLLCGAVLRHGNRDWQVVAAELRVRTACPYLYTPQACKAKYDDLQQQYPGSTALFEELRKQRMAELRRALELSDDSIGSLESRLESLKAERKDELGLHIGGSSPTECQLGYDSSQTESLVPFQKSDGIQSSSKEASKDGLSAGSFTEEGRTNWSPECRVPASFLAQESKIKLEEASVFPEHKKVFDMVKLAEFFIGKGACIRRRRGKRKRKDCTKDVKEGSVGESDFLGSADVSSATRSMENSTSSSLLAARCSVTDDRCRGLSKDETADPAKIFESIADNKCASVFRRRLDSQKRGRYKKMILQHTDFDTIRSRIGTGLMVSTKGLFRDLLLLANNALVFYSKTTREYKSALLLRDIVTKSLRHHLKNYISKSTITLLLATPSILNPPLKPASGRLGKQKFSGKVAKSRSLVIKTPYTGKRPTDSCPPTEWLAMKKKRFGHPRRSRHGSATEQLENST